MIDHVILICLLHSYGREQVHGLFEASFGTWIAILVFHLKYGFKGNLDNHHFLFGFSVSHTKTILCVILPIQGLQNFNSTSCFLLAFK